MLRVLLCATFLGVVSVGFAGCEAYVDTDDTPDRAIDVDVDRPPVDVDVDVKKED